MSKHFSPEADDQMPEKKKSQNRLLLLLLLLVALFAYLYFFTGLIKPREEQSAQAPAPEAAPTDVVKQPLPPRPEAGAQPGATAGEPAADAKGEAPAEPETAPASAAKGGEGAKPAAAPPEAKPAKPAAAQTAQKPATQEAQPAAKPAAAAKAAPGKPAAAEKKQAGGQPAPAKEAKTAAAAKEAKTTAAAKEAKTAAAAKDAKTAAAAKEAKTAAAAKTAQGVNGAGKKGGAADRGKVTAAKAVPATAAGAYAVEIDDLPAAELKSVSAKLKQAGIAPVVTARSQKSEPVHRLYLADFGNRDEALEELERLKLAAPNAFMLKENGRYTVYAGSFVREGRAAVEQDRLYARGVQLLVKSGTATVPVVKLRGGSFATQAKAEQATQSLKQKGISAKVVKAAR